MTPDPPHRRHADGHARIGARALLAANSTVLAGTEIPPECLAAGSPAQVKKALEGAAGQWIETSARHYVELARRYRTQGL